MNRIHHPLVVRIKKRPHPPHHTSTINPSEPHISNINPSEPDVDHSINEYISMNTRSFNSDSNDVDILENLEEFKSRMEDNILAIKHKIDSIEANSNLEDINYALQLIENISSQLEDYKKITNERIEKLVKLFLIVNNKISSLKTQ